MGSIDNDFEDLFKENPLRAIAIKLQEIEEKIDSTNNLLLEDDNEYDEN